MVAIKPRIKANYKPGKGDQGCTNLFFNQKQSQKTGCLTNFYNAIERLQISLADLITFSKEVGFDIENQDLDVCYFLSQVENSLHNLSAFYYTQGNDPKYFLQERLETLLERMVNQWRLECGDSQEFQRFSTHRNLVKIQYSRVESRSLEIAFNDSISNFFPSWYRWVNYLGLSRWQWLSYSLKLGKYDQKLKEVQRYQAFVNRLSYFFWLLTQKERIALGLYPLYWQ